MRLPPQLLPRRDTCRYLEIYRVQALPEKAVKLALRITKARIACAVVLLPVLYILNAGPIAYCSAHFGLPVRVVEVMYGPLISLIGGTALRAPFEAYINWWEALP